MGRRIPGFVFRFFSRILRIDFFNNHILYSHGYKKNVAFARASIEVFKANLEMFFLPNESYKHRNKHFVITFGKPFPFSTFDKRHRPVEWAALVKDYTYTLAENPEREFSAINK